MSTAEIIAQLPRLSSAELAQVQDKLRELVESNRAANNPSPAAIPPRRIQSPRLARYAQSKDFVKQVVELSPDAKL